MEVKDAHALARFDAQAMTKTNLFATVRFFTDVYGLEPGQVQKAHAHEGSDKVYVVLEGRARVSVAGEIADLAPGQAALAPAGSAHGVENPGPGRLKLLVYMAPHPKPT